HLPSFPTRRSSDLPALDDGAELIECGREHPRRRAGGRLVLLLERGHRQPQDGEEERQGEQPRHGGQRHAHAAATWSGVRLCGHGHSLTSKLRKMRRSASVATMMVAMTTTTPIAAA